MSYPIRTLQTCRSASYCIATTSESVYKMFEKTLFRGRGGSILDSRNFDSGSKWISTLERMSAALEVLCADRYVSLKWCTDMVDFGLVQVPLLCMNTHISQHKEKIVYIDADCLVLAIPTWLRHCAVMHQSLAPPPPPPAPVRRTSTSFFSENVQPFALCLGLICQIHVHALVGAWAFLLAWVCWTGLHVSGLYIKYPRIVIHRETPSLKSKSQQ